MTDDYAEMMRDWADHDRKLRRERGERNPIIDRWIWEQELPLCGKSQGDFSCVLSAGHDGGCFMRHT